MKDTILIPPEITRQEFFRIFKRSFLYQIKSLSSTKYSLMVLSLAVLHIIVFWEIPLSFALLVTECLMLSILPSIFLLVHYRLGIIKKLINNELSEMQRIIVFEVLNETIIFPYEPKIKNAPTNNFLKIGQFLFSEKNYIKVFEPIIADWQEEYFEALNKKEICKARWINARYTYAFLAAMFQKSPIGDLIEFIRKIAK